MPRLLVVHHTPSPAMQELLEAAVEGAHVEELQDVETVLRPALAATVPDVLAADGFVLGTPANIGYMSGALKHFFDTIYYPCLQAKAGAPFGVYVHGNQDTGGAVRAVESIARGMGWQKVTETVVVAGMPDRRAREAVWNLAATVAASL